MDNSDDDTDKIGWYFLFAFLIVLIGVDIVNWDSNFFYQNNYHNYFVGLIMWLVFFLRDQIIIDKNLFAKYGLISFGTFLILLVKQFLTTLSYPAIMASLFPLFYIIMLRLIIFAFFPTYRPDINTTPVIVSYTKTGVYWKGQDSGYKPSKRERIFSVLVIVTSMIYMFLTLLFLAFEI